MGLVVQDARDEPPRRTLHVKFGIHAPHERPPLSGSPAPLPGRTPPVVVLENADKPTGNDLRCTSQQSRPNKHTYASHCFLWPWISPPSRCLDRRTRGRCL